MVTGASTFAADSSLRVYVKNCRDKYGEGFVKWLERG